MARAKTRRGRPDGVMLDGSLLRLRRTQMGLSQGALADLARLGVRTVRTAEQGESVSPDTAKLLASSLGLAYIELMRPPPQLVESQLIAHGFGALDPPSGWLDVPAQGALRTALINPAVQVIVVRGPSGVGKTSLVQYEARELGAQFPDGVVWIGGDALNRPDRITDIRLEVAESLGFRNRLPDPTVVSSSAFDRAFQLHFWRWPRLLVLDNVEDPLVVEAFRAGATGKMVVITRTRWVAEAVEGESINVEPWSSDQVLTLLTDTVGAERFEGDASGRDQLLELIGGLPLRAHLSATGLQRTRHQTLGDYIRRIRGALDGEADARVHRDPLLRGLLDGVGRSLPEGAIQALQDLSVSAGTPFGMPFAEVAIGKTPSEVRGLLDVLFDAYMLRDAGIAGRMRIEPWALRAWGSASGEAVSRVVQASPALIRNAVPDSRHDLAAESLGAYLPSIRAVFSAIFEMMQGAVEPASSPDALPEVDAVAERLASVPELVLELTALYRLRPTVDAGAWATLGAAVARANHDDERYMSIAWLLSWWWYLRGDDLDAACSWGAEAARVVGSVGTPAMVVSIHLHVGMIERARGGIAAATPRYEQALTLARQLGCPPSLLAGALLTRASAYVFGEEEPDWQCALTLSAEAKQVCSERKSGREDMLYCGAVTTEAVARAVLGQSTDAAAVNEALAVMVRRLGDDGVMANSGAALVERLGGEHSLPVQEARAVFLHTENQHAEALLQHIVEMATALGATSPGRRDDSLRGTVVGHLAPWVIAGYPLGDSPGPAFDVFLPVGPVGEMLTGANAEYAKRFVLAARGPDHQAMVALQELSESDAS